MSPIFEERGMILGGEMVTGGATPRGEWPFAIDVKGGEIVTLM
jgi:hypothetical protein